MATTNINSSNTASTSSQDTPAIVVDKGAPVKVEGGQAIINKAATTKHFKRLSELNESVGGNPIPDPSEIGDDPKKVDEEVVETTDARKGGLFTGDSHDDGGIPAVVTDTGQEIEVEGREAVLSKEATVKHWKELSEINQSAGNGVPIPAPSGVDAIYEAFEKGGTLSAEDKKQIFEKWDSLVNMTATEINKFLNSKLSYKAGLSETEAKELGISYGRESGRWAIQMKKIRHQDWSDAMWKWAKKQISFISRMSGVRGALRNKKGNFTPKYLSLKLWGHDALKKNLGGQILASTPKQIKQYQLKQLAKEMGIPIETRQYPKRKPLSEEEIKELADKMGIESSESNEEFAEGGLIKIKSFKTDEGNFEIYDTERDPRGRAAMFTVLKDKKGYIIRNAFVPENLQRKGIATKFYTDMNQTSLKKTGNPLRSTPERKLSSGEVVHELSEFGIKLWDSLVEKGLAKKLSTKNYVFFNDDLSNKEFAKGGQVELLAPNGKSSNLSPEQYKLVRTPEFKAWFGDWENDPENASKVLDENGEPLVVYHGTNEEFYIFGNPSYKNRYFFTSDIELSASYGQKNLNLFVNIKNPIIINNDGAAFADTFENEELTITNDGIIYNSQTEKGENVNAVVAFEPTQIKLADGSNTTFDPSNPDIRFKDGGSTNDLDNSKNDSNFDEIKINTTDELSRKVKESKGSFIESALLHLRTSIAASKRDEATTQSKDFQEDILRQFALEKGILFSESDFPKEPTNRGGEQEVYYIGDNTVVKTNCAVFYGYSWEEYLLGLILHNTFFSDTSYKLIGFVVDEDGFKSVVTQPYVGKNGVIDLLDVKSFMADNGFANNRNEDYIHEEFGILIEDLHDENVIKHNDMFFVIDASMYFRPKFSQDDKKTAKVLFAPNGKKSNLTINQWLVVRTPNFKAWFGDWENAPENASKVVDENGEPMVVYHSTPNDFTEFSKDKIGHSIDYGTVGAGFYFTSSLENAQNYANSLPSNIEKVTKTRILECFLNVKNPYIEITHTRFNGYNAEQSMKHSEKLKSKSYDGIETELSFSRKDRFKWFVAFEPTQIKLADGSNTTFDSTNPDIRFAKGGLTKVTDDFFTGEYKGVSYQIIRIPEEKVWYWKIGDEGGDDWYNSKSIVLYAVKEYIKESTSKFSEGGSTGNILKLILFVNKNGFTARTERGSLGTYSYGKLAEFLKEFADRQLDIKIQPKSVVVPVEEMKTITRSLRANLPENFNLIVDLKRPVEGNYEFWNEDDNKLSIVSDDSIQSNDNGQSTLFDLGGETPENNNYYPSPLPIIENHLNPKEVAESNIFEQASEEPFTLDPGLPDLFSSPDQSMKEGGKTDFTKSDIAQGTKVELEHAKTIEKYMAPDTDVKEVAESIAVDHLKETKDYYDILAKLELAEGGAAPKQKIDFSSRIVENLSRMNTSKEDWSALEIIGEHTIKNANGNAVTLPTYDIQPGYIFAPTMFKSTKDNPCCELCGKTPIKRFYMIKNDNKKWLLSVGSECVTHFGEGESGEDLLRENKIKQAHIADNKMITLRRMLSDKFRSKHHGGYGIYETKWRNSSIPTDDNGQYQIFIDPKNPTDFIKWKYVYDLIPTFGFELQVQRNFHNTSKAIEERKLLSWYTKNKEKIEDILNAWDSIQASGAL